MSVQYPVGDGKSQYAGWMMLGGEYSFTRLRISAANVIALDLPNQFQFNLPAREPVIASSELRFRAGDLAFEGQISGQQIYGIVRDRAGSGTFELHAVQPVDSSEFRLLAGHYTLSRRGEIAFSQDTRPDEQLCFYNHDDRVVRLYPLGAARFLSERCAMISFNRPAGGRV